jgi:hypothetical protein
MKFMLMMNAPRGKGDWQVLTWPPEDLKAHIGFMMRFSKELWQDSKHSGAELPQHESIPALCSTRQCGPAWCYMSKLTFQA